MNRRTALLGEALRARGYQDPLVVLAEIYSRKTEGLAKELGCTRLEALDLQRKCALDSLPYWHQKRPLAVEHEHAPAPQTADELASEIIDLLQNQRLIDVTPEPVGREAVGREPPNPSDERKKDDPGR